MCYCITQSMSGNPSTALMALCFCSVNYKFASSEVYHAQLPSNKPFGLPLFLTLKAPSKNASDMSNVTIKKSFPINTLSIYRDGSSWVEPVLRLLNDTMLWALQTQIKRRYKENGHIIVL